MTKPDPMDESDHADRLVTTARGVQYVYVWRDRPHAGCSPQHCPAECHWASEDSDPEGYFSLAEVVLLGATVTFASKEGEGE